MYIKNVQVRYLGTTAQWMRHYVNPFDNRLLQESEHKIRRHDFGYFRPLCIDKQTFGEGHRSIADRRLHMFLKINNLKWYNLLQNNHFYTYCIA